MTKYVIDAYAWIEYFVGSTKGLKVKEIIENKSNDIFTSVLTIAEIISIVKREKKDTELAYKIILNLSKIYPMDEEFAKKVGLLYSDIKKKIKDFGLADVFVLLTARTLNARIVTGDPHFEDIKNVILV